MGKERVVGAGATVCTVATKLVLPRLRLATDVLVRERLLNEPFTGADGPYNCESLSRSWKEWTEALPPMTGVRGHERASALKGTKRLFDITCQCDKKRSLGVKERWLERACGQEATTARPVLEEVRFVARSILDGWKARGLRDVTIQTQQGCAEMTVSRGGTLSVPFHWEKPLSVPCQSFCPDVRERKDVSLCRVGVAKTKGKFRVVTMQGARAKRKLTRLHSSLYDYLSRRKWLVRGPVTAERFRAVCKDLKEGENLISGDYEQSTDLLHLDAVQTVVDVIADKCPRHMAKILRESFRPSVQVGEDWLPVVRGSMMGNLCSFVVLCVLNRVCYSMARRACGESAQRPCLINGDDFLACGGGAFWEAWLTATASVGFKINKEKTMRSRRFAELNSTVFDSKKDRTLRRLCYGFLSSDVALPRESVGPSLFDLLPQLGFPTAAWLVSTYLVRRLLERVPPVVSTVPPRWWRFLRKRWWFRRIYVSGKAPNVDVQGLERVVPVVYGPPLRETDAEIEDTIARCRGLIEGLTGNLFRGRVVRPEKRKVSRGKLTGNHGKAKRIGRERVSLKRLWDWTILDYVVKNGRCGSLWQSNFGWVDEQPGLVWTSSLDILPQHLPDPDWQFSEHRSFDYWLSLPQKALKNAR